MSADDTRRHELMAGALADDLSAAERAELDALRAVDPTIDAELAELRTTVTALGELDRWREADAGPGAASEGDSSVTPVRRSGSRRWVAALAAAACLGAGLLVGSALPALLDRPVTGPPGTLGAIEHISFGAAPGGARIDADLVAHTWGTETILEIDGLPAGEAFEVVLVDAAGREHASGTFLGSAVTIECRVNAAVLREDVVAVEIRDDRGDVAVADIPPIA